MAKKDLNLPKGANSKALAASLCAELEHLRATPLHIMAEAMIIARNAQDPKMMVHAASALAKYFYSPMPVADVKAMEQNGDSPKIVTWEAPAYTEITCDTEQS